MRCRPELGRPLGGNGWEVFVRGLGGDRVTYRCRVEDELPRTDDALINRRFEPAWDTLKVRVPVDRFIDADQFLAGLPRDEDRAHLSDLFGRLLRGEPMDPRVARQVGTDEWDVQFEVKFAGTSTVRVRLETDDPNRDRPVDAARISKYLLATVTARLNTEDRRRQIAEAALKVVAEQGLGRFTTAAIAREVGISEGALFRHFASKEEIVLAAMDRVDELLFAGLPPSEADPLERLRALIRHRARVVSEHPFIGRVLFSDDLAYAGPKGAEKVMQWRMRTLLLVRDCLEEAIASGRVREDVPIEHLLIIFQGTILGTLFILGRFEGVQNLPGLADEVFGSFETLIRR